MIDLDLEDLDVVCGGADNIFVNKGAEDGSYYAIIDGRKYSGTGYADAHQFGMELAGIQGHAAADPAGQRYEFTDHPIEANHAPYVSYGEFRTGSDGFLGSGVLDTSATGRAVIDTNEERLNPFYEPGDFGVLA